MKKRTILASFVLPVVIVIALFWVIVDIKPRPTAYALTLPTSQMTTDKVLESYGMNNGPIDKVEFLNIDGSDNVGLSDEVMMNVVADPEFQKQVNALKAMIDESNASLLSEDSDKKTELPPLGVLVSLFLMSSLALGGAVRNRNEYVNVDLGKKLSDFFSFDTTKKIVTKAVDVVKKVPIYTTRVVKEIVKKVIQVPKQIAYTAYKTVKNVAYKTRTWVEEVVRPKPQNPVDVLKSMSKFMEETFKKYPGSFDRATQRNARYLFFMNDYTGFDQLKVDYDDVRSGRKVGRFAQRVNDRYNHSHRDVRDRMYGFLKGLEQSDPTVYAKVKKEYDALIEPTYVQKIVHKVTEPVVTFVKQAYTAYRTEYDAVETEKVVEHTVTDVSYKDVVETQYVQEEIIEKQVTPLKEKIALALNYVKNLPRIKSSPSNRGFSDILVSFGRGTAFDGLMKSMRNLDFEIKNAYMAPNDPSNAKWQNISVQRYNSFIKSMKQKAYAIRTSENPMEAMFGRQYTDAIADNERVLAEYKAKLAQLDKDRNDLLAHWPVMGSGLRAARSKYESIRDNMRQMQRRIADLEDRLKDGKKEMQAKFNGMLDDIDRLAYLKDVKTWAQINSQSEITFGIGDYSPLLAVNGLKPVFAGHSTGAQALYAATAAMAGQAGGTKNIGTYYASLTNNSGTAVASAPTPTAVFQTAGWLEDTFGAAIKQAESKTMQAQPQVQSGKVISEKVLGSSNPVARWWRSGVNSFKNTSDYISSLQSELEVDVLTNKKGQTQAKIEGAMLNISSLVLPVASSLGTMTAPFVEKSVDIMDYITNNPNWSLQNYFGQNVYETEWYNNFNRWWVGGVEPTYEEVMAAFNRLPDSEKRTFETAGAFYASVLTLYGASKFVEGSFTKLSKPLAVYSDDAVFSTTQSIQKAIIDMDLRGAKINGKIEIPKDWMRIKARGEGWIYSNPYVPDEVVRVMKKGSNAQYPNYEQPYFRWSKGDMFYDINGNVAPSNSELSHTIIKSIEL